MYKIALCNRRGSLVSEKLQKKLVILVRANRDKDKRASCPVAAERDPSVVSQRSDNHDRSEKLEQAKALHHRSASVAPSSSYEEALAAFGSTGTVLSVHHSTSTNALTPPQTATLAVNNQISFSAGTGFVYSSI